jgi:hypothetical protein
MRRLTQQQVHYALSAEKQWSDNNAAFNYAVWYEQILTYFDNLPEVDKQIILDWYQM